MNRSRLHAAVWLQAIFTLALTISAASPAHVPRLDATAGPSPRILLLDAAVSDGNVVAVGERGLIAISADSGLTWKTVPSGVSATLTGVSFAPDSPHGWAVGHDAVILATRDGGQTWEKQWQGPDLEASFLDVCAVDAARILAIGAFGFAARSHDGGDTWTAERIVDDDAHLNRITRAAADTLFIAGERGTVLRSTNRGESWIALSLPYEGSFHGVLPLRARELLVYGLRGHVYRSTDAGTTWERVPLDRPMLIATAAQTPSGLLVLAGQSRALYVSRDAGKSFQASTHEFAPAIAELLVAPDGAVLAFGEEGAARLPLDSVGEKPTPATFDSRSTR
jgi:photosystem II stability/assembly factor-like uncharacterized protein